MKKLIVGLFAAFAVGVSFTAFAGRTVSFVSFSDNKVNLAIEGEGPTASLIMGYGTSDGGNSPDGWEHVVGEGVVLSNQTSAAIALPAGWGDGVAHLKFFLYAGIADRPSYVSDGLVACWDAYDNSARGTHDWGNTTTWVDTVGGRTFRISDLQDHQERSLRLEASLDAESSALLLNYGTNTVESMFDVVTGSAYAFYGTAKSKVAWFNYYNCQFFSSSTGPGVATGEGANTYAAVYDQVTEGRSYPQIACYRNGEERNDRSTYWNAGNTEISLKYNVNFRTLRFYNRALTAEELQLNAWIDRVRYVDQATTGIIVSSVHVTPAGAIAAVKVSSENGTVSGAGDYAVGTTVTLTATPSSGYEFFYWDGLPADLDATQAEVSFTADCDRAVTAVFKGDVDPIDPVGRPLTITAVSKDEQDNPVAVTIAIGEDASRTDTLYVAYAAVDAGEDIRYWTHVEPIRAILPGETTYTYRLPHGWKTSVQALRFFMRDGVDANSYVKDNLVAQWDGTDNVATGVHDPTATTWVDRVNGYTFELSGASFNDRSVFFSGTATSYAEMDAVSSSATFGRKADRTVEICVDTHKETTPSGILLSGPNGSNVLIAPYGGNTYFADVSAPLYKANFATPAKSVSVSYDSVNAIAGVFVDGVTPQTGGNGGWGGMPAVTRIGASGAYKVGGDVYGLRLYSSILTANERAVNRAVDTRIAAGEIPSGRTVSCSDALLAKGKVVSKFTVAASVLCGTVSGEGEYEEGMEVTVSVTMDEGCRFLRWTGDVPMGVDPTSSSITFVIRSNVALGADVWTPWKTVTGEGGSVTEIFNGEWRFKVTAEGTELTLTERISGNSETLDVTHIKEDTGYALVEIGENVFRQAQTPTRILHPGNELKRIGDGAFWQSALTAFEPDVIPSLMSIGDNAFYYASIRGLYTPSLTNLGGRAFAGASQLTNVIKQVFDFPLPSRAFDSVGLMRGSVIVDSPSTVIPDFFLYACNALTNIIVRSRVERVEDGAFVLRDTVPVRWKSRAPKFLGNEGADVAHRVFGGNAPYLKIFAQCRVREWAELPEFKPIGQIDDSFKTEAYGWTPRAIGWIETDNGFGSGFHHAWVVDDTPRGLMLILR